jgi:hypothetical protein
MDRDRHVSRPASRTAVRRLRAAPPALHLAFEAGGGRHRIWGTALAVPAAVSLQLLGGDVPHIGAVGVSLPRPGRPGKRPGGPATSVIALPGHREDELARPIAAELARALGRTAVVVAGIHLEAATARDVAALVRNARRAARLVLAAVRAAAGDGRRRRPRAARAHPQREEEA